MHKKNILLLIVAVVIISCTQNIRVTPDTPDITVPEGSCWSIKAEKNCTPSFGCNWADDQCSNPKVAARDCVFRSGIGCLDYEIDYKGPNNKGRITLNIQNVIGYDIDEVVVTASNCGKSQKSKMINGQQSVHFIDCQTAIRDKLYVGKVNVSFRVVQTNMTYINEGRLIGLVNMSK